MYGVAQCNSLTVKRPYQKQFTNRILPCQPNFSFINISENQEALKHQKLDKSGRSRWRIIPELEEGMLDKMSNNPQKSTGKKCLQ